MSDGASRDDAVRDDGALRRVQALVQAARELANPTSDRGQRARRELASSTGLSAAGVELALAECLETTPSAADLAALVASVRPARRVHVVLPANVFVAAHRAIALGLAASADVCVRASRREPHLARHLAEAAPGLFELCDELRPAPGDEVWAYGSDTSLEAIESALPGGVALHAHGPGFGVAVVEASHLSEDTAAQLVADIVPFDQRGCLSPRAALVVGTRHDALRFAELVTRALDDAARRVPLGRLDDAERAELRAFRDAHTYAGSLVPGRAGVAVSEGRLTLAPVGRNLVLVPCEDPAELLRPNAAGITALGLATATDVAATLARELPNARCSELGRMQRPPLDGPADRRL